MFREGVGQVFDILSPLQGHKLWPWTLDGLGLLQGQPETKILWKPPTRSFWLAHWSPRQSAQSENRFPLKVSPNFPTCRCASPRLKGLPFCAIRPRLAQPENLKKRL